jgi:hypothetical protein
MIEISFAVLSPVDVFLKEKMDLKSAYEIDFGDTLHFSPSNAVLEQLMYGDDSACIDIYNKLSGVDGIAEVLRFGLDSAVYENFVSEDETYYTTANLLVYSNELQEKVNFKLISGELETGESEYATVLVDEKVALELPVGTVKELELGEGKKMLCKVTGILDSDSAIPVIMNYGSNPSMGVLGIFPYDEDVADSKFIVLYGDTDSIIDEEMGASFIICPEKQTDIAWLSERLQNSVGIYGTVQTTDKIISYALKNILTENAWYMFMFVLLTLIAVFGYGGYLFLMIRQRQTEFGLFYILGTTRIKMIKTIFLSGLCVLTAAFVIASIAKMWFLNNVLGIGVLKGGFFSLVFCALLLLMVLMFSVLAGFKQYIKNEEAEIFKGGD